MRKLNSLRDHLKTALPELERSPEALHIYAEGGSIATRDGLNLGFEMRYEATITLPDCRYHPAQIFLPIVIWLRQWQREVIQNHQTGTERIRFKVEPIDDQAADIEIKLPLSEALDVLPNSNAGYDMHFRDEPPVPGLEPLTDPAVLLRQIWGKVDAIPPEFWTGYED
ncbi:MAG: phage tail protein [Sphingobium sp.]|nr:phage tail protein [Sphingobium sp.]